MARLPVLKRRRSKRQRALDLAKRAAKVWTAAKVSAAGTRAAKKGAKAFGAAKGTQLAGRPLIKVAAVPVAVAGGVAVWRKTHSGSGSNGASADAGRPLGPVASADTVSPPADAAAEAARNEQVHTS